MNQRTQFASYEIEAILNDIYGCIEAKLYYPAILIALTVPEFCSGLAMPMTQFVKQKHYVEFIDTYTEPKDIGATGIDIFRLRGGLVHRGNLAGHAFADWTHVIFTTPETGPKIHGISLKWGEKKAAMLDVNLFCDAMIKAARVWYSENSENPLVMENMAQLMRSRPSGVSQFIKGNVVASGHE